VSKAVDLNAVRYNPVRLAGHVESYFLKANDPSGERALWIKATILAGEADPLRPVAEGWAIAFDRRGGQRRHVAVKHTLPFEAAAFSRSGLGLGWKVPAASLTELPAELSLTPGESAGLVVGEGHRLAWALRFSQESAPLVHYAHPQMYEAPVPSFKLCSPTPDARFEGSVEVDGERWSLDGWRGMQGHNWGKGYADPYAWSHCATWDEGDDFLLEGVSAKVALGPVKTPLLTLICVRHQGRDYAFNQPVELLRASGEIGARRWEFAAKSREAQIEGSVEAGDDDFVGLYYPNPDGRMTYCLNTKLGAARVRFQPRGGAAITRSTRRAALEIGTHDPGHGVRMYV
jgi:hypothetical protein